MVFQCINIRQVPREVLKTAASGLGFQQLPRDLTNVNAWKNMFDPYSIWTPYLLTILIPNLKWFILLYLLMCLKYMYCCIYGKQFRPWSVAQLDAPSDWRPGGRGFNPRRGRQHSFVEIDYEIFSTVILSLPLIQEGQLSVSGERMCTILVNRLED